MTDRSDKRIAAVMAAVQQYLDEEARSNRLPKQQRSLSLWKSIKWRTIRDPAHHPTNPWKHSVWG